MLVEEVSTMGEMMKRSKEPGVEKTAPRFCSIRERKNGIDETDNPNKKIKGGVVSERIIGLRYRGRESLAYLLR